MARPDESGSISPDPRTPQLWGCQYVGAVAEDLYEPLVTFARSHLVENDSKYPVNAHLVSDLDHEQRDQGTNIQVAPHLQGGALSITLELGNWSAGNTYCLVVHRDGAHATVVVSPGWHFIQ